MFSEVYRKLYGENAGKQLSEKDKIRGILQCCFQNTWKELFSEEQLKAIERIKKNRVWYWR